MNIDEIKAEFERVGLPKDSYSFGEQGSGDNYCIMKSDSIWEVYYNERGNKTVQNNFILKRQHVII
jgi:hypothetical protein